MAQRGDGHAHASSSSEPLLGIRDGITTPTPSSYSGVEGWRRHLHERGAPSWVWVAAIAALGLASGLSVPDVYSPLPYWAAKVSSTLGAAPCFAVLCPFRLSP